MISLQYIDLSCLATQLASALTRGPNQFFIVLHSRNFRTFLISTMSDHLSPKVSTGRSRKSSVGNMNAVGQSSLTLSSTISTKDKHRRLKQLNSSKIKGDRDLLLKFYNSFVELSFRITWLVPFLIVASTYLCYFLSNNYTASNPLHKFVTISYKTDAKDENGYYLYDKGPKDFAFVLFYMIFFTFFREFCMLVLVKPLARKAGFTNHNKIKRFMEQFYSLIYYGLSSPFGFFVMMKLPVKWFDTYYFYESYPHYTIFSWMKLFYLGQAAFWTQQATVLALQLEKPRKDYYELIFHHIITMALIYASYTFNFTWIGIAVYLTMDSSDYFLSASKLLNYLDSRFTPYFFVVFVFVWIYMRHYISIRILWSVLTQFETVGPYELNFKTGQYKCFISKPIVFGLLFALQAVNAYWLFLILRILARTIFSGETKDDRSDDEEDEEDPDQYEGYSTDSSEDNRKKQK